MICTMLLFKMYEDNIVDIYRFWRSIYWFIIIYLIVGTYKIIKIHTIVS